MFEEARAADTPEDLRDGLQVGCARLSATGAFSDLDAAVEEVRLDRPTVVGGRHGVKLRVAAKPLRISTQVGASVNGRGETEAFTEVRVPNLTGALDSFSVRVGEDQGDLIADAASVAKFGSSSGGGGGEESGSMPLSSPRGPALLAPRQSSPWVQLSYRRPTLAGTRWSLDVSGRQSATSWDSRQSFRLREREFSAVVASPSGEHRFGAVMAERRPRVTRVAAGTPLAGPSAEAILSSAAAAAAAGAGAGAADGAADGPALLCGPYDTTASAAVCAATAPSVKGALTYAFDRDWRTPRVGASRGGRLGFAAEFAGIPGLGNVAHVKAEVSGSYSTSVGRFAPDTGYAHPPTSSEAASKSTLRGLRRAAAEAGLRPHPGLTALPFLPAAGSARSRREAIVAVHDGKAPKPSAPTSRVSLDADADEAGWRDRVAAWLSPGLTVTLDGACGLLLPIPALTPLAFTQRAAETAAAGVEPRSAAALAAVPSTRAAASNIVDRFQLGQPRLRGFASDGVGPRAGTVAGGNETGDSLGGDAMVCGTARIFGPPPLPSATLANAGVRTHAWASGGIVLPGPLRALAPVANSLVDWHRWSASVGLGVSVPVGSMGLAEVNFALAHWGSHRDLRQQWSLSFTG